MLSFYSISCLYWYKTLINFKNYFPFFWLIHQQWFESETIDLMLYSLFEGLLCRKKFCFDSFSSILHDRKVIFLITTRSKCFLSIDERISSIDFTQKSISQNAVTGSFLIRITPVGIIRNILAKKKEFYRTF